MKTKFGRCLLWLAAFATISGCASMSEREECIVASATAGGLVGGGIGTGVALSKKHQSDYVEWVVPTGVAGGALIGGVAGYLLCPTPPPPAPPPAPPPPPPPPAPPPPPPPVPEKIILRGVHFDFDKSNIRPQDAAVLDEAAETLKAHPNITVNVNGYCDAIGSVRYNLKLSERRSDAVVKYLADHGIAESRLSPHGYGKTDFVATNKTAEGRAQNRRVEMVPNQ